MSKRRLLVKWGLKLIQPSVGFADDDIEICLKAIALRNNIIHNAMHESKIKISDARLYIFKIRKIIDTLENWYSSKGGKT